MGTISTSLVINFDAGDSEGILTAEVDDREDGYNAGETSFIPGDSPAFLIYKTSNVTVTSIIASLGSVSVIGNDSRLIEENLNFTKTREASPGYPIYSGFAAKWLGAIGGTVTQTESKLTIPVVAVAVLNIEYYTYFTAYRLSNIPTSVNGETSFPVVIYIEGTAV